MAPHVDGLRQRGIEATAIDLPKGQAERAIPVYAERLRRLGPAVIGGHSYGGRVASMLAASAEPGVRGLVLLSYPLHRPGHHEDQRTEHWARIECPVLLVSGESDPFANFELLRTATRLLAHAELVGYPGAGHGLSTVLPDALNHVATFVRRLAS